MTELITPKVLKGFRDFLPKDEILRRSLIEKLELSFRGFGFVPVDTPALEYAEILLGKGGGETEKQVYRFNDAGGRDVALRFDLTVPFARFVAEHKSELVFPFKRYHIAKVWRGENTQRGRYREFTQCDFDSIGSDNAASDFEILFMIKESLAALGAGDLTICVNHRGLFNRFLKKIDAQDKLVEILRAVDKLSKIGREAVCELLKDSTGDSKKAQAILEYVDCKGSWTDTLAMMTAAAGGDNPDSARLALIQEFIKDTGCEGVFKIDPSITRGLDYYTGIVAETFLDAMPDIGSVCSGGRYDNLLSLYSKDSLSGVGASIGLDRLIAALELIGKCALRDTYAACAIACVDEGQYGAAQAVAAQIRAAGIPCEVLSPQTAAAGGASAAAPSMAAKKNVSQFILAEKRGIKKVIVPEDGKYKIRDIATRSDTYAPSIGELLSAIGTGGGGGITHHDK